MKKTLFYSFLIIVIFLICLSLSIIVKKYFNIEGDYLSAFATLITVIVAYHLFSDWKVEHKFNLIYQFHSSLKEQNYKINNHLKRSKLFFSTIEGSTVEKGEARWIDGVTELRLFITIIADIEYVFNEYLFCLSKMQTNKILKNHIQNLRKNLSDLNAIRDEFFTALPEPYRGISATITYLEFIDKWQQQLKSFDAMCKKDLSFFILNI